MPNPKGSKVVVVGLGAVAALGVGLSFLTRRPSPWQEWRGATCMPDACFCETIADSFVRQPTNVMTSLAFLAVAVLLPGAYSRAREARADASPILSSSTYLWIYVSALLLIGLASAFFHSSLSFVGQTFDELGMYLIATFLLVYNWARLRPISPRLAGVVYVLGNSLFLALLIVVPEARRYVFAMLVLVAVGLELTVQRTRSVQANTRLFALALALFLVGSGLFGLDVTRAVCDPASLYQGHGAWHLLGAVSAGLIFMYYLSEDLREPSSTSPPPRRS
jgi:ceramidase